jgi:hypothetical protein
VRGSRSALVALWVTLALVVVASGWVGVHMVGQTLAPSATPVLSDAEMDALLATAKARPGLGPSSTSSPGAHHGSGQPSPRPSKDGTESPEPGGGQQGTSGGDPGSSASPGASAKTVVRTFRSRGGSAVVACTGSRITLRAWSPAVGYSLEEREVGYDELEVKFEGSSGESTIHARCEAGVPVAEVDSGGESGDD